MTWATPRTWVTGEVVRARYLNQDVSQALLACVPQVASLLTSSTTTSTTYADLADGSIGPGVSASTLTSCVTFHSVQAQNSTIGSHGISAIAVSGATTLAASDTNHVGGASNVAAHQQQHGQMTQFTGLTPGINAFTMKYRVPSGTGTFQRRWLMVIPQGA